ncbi:type I restriction-modification system subunit M [Fodinibius halophilus]|uniref:site-specific DNA-methyltransferase (adenine-specific) n=1 Tax=Fodinibius halophilus TaxID=1736908 RepID=A0A6M1TMX7_9BACT|nr:class I SAM-dependent DNA methyltransferase [Fodinibius halophilus]NGP89690.1 SAM-dependent DNA methyltransferase [Fodinibius halophilus]
MLTGEIRNKVDNIWETLWTAGISNPLTVIEQLTYLLFIKGLDDKQLRQEKKAERTGKPIKNPTFGPDEEHLRWRNIKELDPKAMFERIRDEVFPFIKELGGENGDTYRKHMEGAIFMFPKASTLSRVVELIDQLDMKNRDTKGDIYEYMLSKLNTAGQNGQFRTPRHIIKMMVELTQPKPLDKIADPACGTAGFLVAAGEYIRENHAQDMVDEKVRKHFKSDMFTGFDFDRSMLRIGNMNMVMHGFEGAMVDYKDSLSSETEELRNKYDLILANPPFKGSLDYDSVATDLLQTVKTKKTELLFIALFLKALKTGGRTAVIVPDGVLFNSSNAHKKIRKILVEEQQLNAVISMPSGVFKPYAGVSTAVLLFTKTESGGTEDVWFYDMEADGYSLDDKREEIEENDIPEIIKRYRNLENEKKRERTDKSFLVPKKEIVNEDYDLSINRYKEIEYEENEYATPNEIINGKNDKPGLRQLAEERLKLLRELEEMI